jgi:ribosome biogenesis GTPase / thiamine phosphate phosphatase
MHKLFNLGFSPFFEKQLLSEEFHNLIPARIASEHRSNYEIWSENGSSIAKLAGLYHQEISNELHPKVGDWVGLTSEPSSDQISTIKKVFKRQSVFERGSAGGGSGKQVIAANVNSVFIVVGLDSNYNLNRIERYLTQIWNGGASPVIILNKSDICEDAHQKISEVELRNPGVQIVLTSAILSEGLLEIRPLIQEGSTSVFVGSSGVGKSTLINSLLGEEKMSTGEVRSFDDRGRHTTTHREMFHFPEGGILIDTPGMRELQLFGSDGIKQSFADIEELAAQCRFKDCRHESEPGCAVKEAANSGILKEERLHSYFKIQREIESFELRQDEHLRRQTDREFGKMVNQVKQMKLVKGLK